MPRTATVAALIAVGIFAAFTGLSAQTDEELSRRRAQQARETDDEQESAPGFRLAPPPRETVTAPVSFGDADIGEQWILKELPKYESFVVFGDVSGFATSNAALTKENTLSDWFMVARVGASFQPRFSDTLQGELTVSQAFFRYNDFNVFDFNSTNVGAGLTKIATKLWNIAFFCRYNYTYLSDNEFEQQIFESNSITIGAQKSFIYSRSHYAYVGYSSAFAWSDPYATQRNEHGLYAGYHLFITRDLEFDAYTRFAWYDYTQDRNDFNGALNLALRYNFTEWLNITTSFSAAVDRSNQSFFDYNVFNGGAGVQINARF